MTSNLSRSRTANRKTCLLCYMSPQNILVLACDHSVCLQCAYTTLKNRQINSMIDEIEFRCIRCTQVTYFDTELIKQIESSIRPYQTNIQPATQYNHFHSKADKSQSFIQKMKNQYLSQKSENIPSRLSNVPNNKNFNSYNQIQKNKVYDDSQNMNQRFIYNYNQNSITQTHQRSQKPKETKFNQINSQVNSKCKLHSHYELIYFCLKCQQTVCSQCLLRGKHKQHENQTISQILENELPKFINQISQKLLNEVNQIEIHKDKKYSQLNQKIREITNIRHNAKQYFIEVKKNIQKEENEVLQRCDSLLQNLRREENQNQLCQKQNQIRLTKYIQEIKSLKSSYKLYLNDATKNTTQNIGKSLIYKFINCSISIKDFFQHKNNSRNLFEDNKQNINSPEVGKQGQILNKKIEESISSIRQSLVFDSFSHFRKMNQQQQQKHKPTECQSRISVKSKENQKINQKPLINQYISYISTENSPNKSKQLRVRQKQRSVSISPYKEQHLTYQQKRNNILFKKSNSKKIDDFGKQNIWIQPQQKQFRTNKLSSEASSQNVSSKKYFNKSINNSKSKSKNSSINKKKHFVTNNNLITKFKA